MQCENCQTELTGKANYCSNCGQKNIAKLNLRYILGQLFDTLLNWDSKFFVTLKYLLFRPGYLTKSYMEGKRVSYVPPVRLYIFTSVFFFFVVSVMSKLDFETTDQQVQGISMSVGDIKLELSPEELKQMQCDGVLDTYVDSLITNTPNTTAVTEYFARKMIYSQANNESFGTIFSNQLSLFLLLFIPFLALMYSTVFSGNKYGFVPHLIFNFHLNSFFILLLLLPRLIVPFLDDNLTLIGIVVALTFIGSQAYLLRAIKVFYQRKWYINIYKYLFLVLGYISLALVFIVVVFLSSLVAA